MVGIGQSDDESCLARGVDISRVVVRRSLLAIGHELDTENVARRRVVIVGDGCADRAPRGPRRPCLVRRLGKHVHRARDDLTRQRVSGICDSVPLHWACFPSRLRTPPHQIGGTAPEHKPRPPGHRRIVRCSRSTVYYAGTAGRVRPPARRAARARHGRAPVRVELPHGTRAESTTVDAGGRELRVSSADRVIFPATERTAAVTKLDVVEYYLSVEDGIMRALARRPTTLERWPKGVHPGIVLSTREKGGGDAFFQKRVPRGAPDYVETTRITFPSGRHADEIRPTEIAVVGWAAQMGTITFHPWPVRDERRRPSRRAAHRPRPPARHRLRRRRARRRRGARAARTSSATRDSRRRRAAAASTSTSGSSRAGRSPTCATPRSRSAASSSGGCPGEVTTNWWKEERGERIFVDYNQNARDRTIASAYSVRPKPGAPVSAPLTWDELPEVAPEDFTVATMPARFAEVGDRHAAIDDVSPLAAAAARPVRARRRARAQADMPYPPDYPKMPGEPKRVQPSRDRDRPRD